MRGAVVRPDATVEAVHVVPVLPSSPAPGLVPAGTLPRTEFKARRVIDDRDLYRQSLQATR